ncbi:Ig-like domain-containing protein [Jiulongibacter sp. NS-SX5]|uniref:Ig-like domain-containing protein n=1 Tax=Jiulongibacter sp. NS-SX5 TaxID=3463854 RepID=UPI0040586772
MKTKPLIILAFLALALSSKVYCQVIIQQTDSLTKDQFNDAKANPGDSIRYKVKVIVNGSADNTSLDIEALDSELGVDPNSVHIGPLARPDNYQSLSNIGIEIIATTGLLANDADIDAKSKPIKIVKVGSSFSVDKDTSAFFQTAFSGLAKIESNGSFEYHPAAGYNGTDSFYYEISDGDSLTPNVRAKVSITVGGVGSPVVWFVDATNGDDTNGDGSLYAPFKTLNPLNGGSDPDGNNDIIYLYSGNYTVSAFTLEGSQKLIGQGVALNLTEFGLLAPSYSENIPSQGSNPILNSTTDGLILNSDNIIRGLTVGNCSGVAIKSSTLNVGALKVSSVEVNNAAGGGLSITHGSSSMMNLSFNRFICSGGSDGINLTQCSGSFTVAASGSNSISGNSKSVNLSSNSGLNFTFPGAISASSATSFIEIDQNSNCTFTFNTGNISSTAKGIKITNNSLTNINFNNPSITLNGLADIGISSIANLNGTVGFAQAAALTVNTTSSYVGLEVSNSGNFNMSKGSITSTTGGAVKIDNTNLGIQLEAVSSNGAAEGIYLSTTTGYFRLIGDGSNLRNGSGGSIQNSQNEGVKLINVVAVDLSSLNVSGSSKSGIYGESLQGFSFKGLSVENNGDGLDEHGIDILNFSSSSNAEISNCQISNSRENNINIVLNTSSSGQSLSITNSIINNLQAVNGSNGVYFEAGTGSNATLTLTGNTINDNYGMGLNAQVINSGILNVNATQNSFNSGITATYEQRGGILLGSSSSGTLAFTVDRNNGACSEGNAISVLGVNGNYSGSIINNQLLPGTQGIGINTRTEGIGTGTIVIDGNTIGSGGLPATTTNAGIHLSSRNGTGNINATVSNNVIEIQESNFPSPVLIAESGSLAGTNTLCLNLSGNQINHSNNLVPEYMIGQYNNSTFSLEGLPSSPETNALNVETYLASLDTGKAVEVLDGGNYIVNYTNSTCTTLP